VPIRGKALTRLSFVRCPRALSGPRWKVSAIPSNAFTTATGGDMLERPSSSVTSIPRVAHLSSHPNLARMKMLPFPGRLLVAATLLALPASPIDDRAPLRGFSEESARIEREWESKFRSIPEPDSLREAMRILSSRPHHLGSPRDSANADWILQKFRSWGLDAKIETFQVLFATPKDRVVELVAPHHFSASLREPALKDDPTSSQQAEQLPTYNAFSRDGDVTAPLVYVNYGIPEDYDRLKRLGISVEGAIVIARYGRSWRGIKPKVAAEHGAVGCLLYSDPQDDGYHAGDVYPRGPFRPRYGVQRGSVLDMPLYAGDPLTPGVGATADAKRLDRTEAPTITKIPVLPLSYADAEPLLQALGGRPAPQSWMGGLPITYHLGLGPARVHLRVRSNWRLTPARDVIVRIPGSVAPDEWVVRGNHHDAWVNGAEDPISGQVALLEEARGLGALLKQGWRPRRTIILAAWDGEEPMLLGSTEWVETHAEELAQHAVAYINTDGNARGFLNADGSPALQRLISQVARDIADPEANMSALSRARLRAIATAGSADRRKEARARADLPVGPMGSGSDYTAFYHHLGIPSLDLSFGGEDDGGIYHSIYDSFHWFTTFSDTAFVYERALAQTVGTTIMRLADAEMLPYEFASVTQRVRTNLREVQDLLKTMRDSVEEQNRQVKEGTFVAMNDPRRPTVAPTVEEVPPHLNFTPVENGADRLGRAADKYEEAVTSAMKDGGKALRSEGVARVNALLLLTERALAPEAGLPRRPWYKNLLSAPGWYTGYAAKSLPGVREAIEGKRWTEVEEQAAALGRMLEEEAAAIDRATAALERLH
jgi:N-acetylated-alpha-linked acidic dipeptidase